MCVCSKSGHYTIYCFLSQIIPPQSHLLKAIRLLLQCLDFFRSERRVGDEGEQPARIASGFRVNTSVDVSEPEPAHFGLALSVDDGLELQLIGCGREVHAPMEPRIVRPVRNIPARGGGAACLAYRTFLLRVELLDM